MKTKHAIKYGLKHPELFSQAELDYFRLVKKARDDYKKKQKVHSDKKSQ